MTSRPSRTLVRGGHFFWPAFCLAFPRHRATPATPVPVKKRVSSRAMLSVEFPRIPRFYVTSSRSNGLARDAESSTTCRFFLAEPATGSRQVQP